MHLEALPGRVGCRAGLDVEGEDLGEGDFGDPESLESTHKQAPHTDEHLKNVQKSDEKTIKIDENQ